MGVAFFLKKIKKEKEKKDGSCIYCPNHGRVGALVTLLSTQKGPFKKYSQIFLLFFSLFFWLGFHIYIYIYIYFVGLFFEASIKNKKLFEKLFK